MTFVFPSYIFTRHTPIDNSFSMNWAKWKTIFAFKVQNCLSGIQKLLCNLTWTWSKFLLILQSQKNKPNAVSNALNSKLCVLFFNKVTKVWAKRRKDKNVTKKCATCVLASLTAWRKSRTSLRRILLHLPSPAFTCLHLPLARSDIHQILNRRGNVIS